MSLLSRSLTWLSAAIVVFSLIIGVQFVSGPVTNTDTYFHLRIGHEFLSGWDAHSPGRISQFGTAEWYPTQWLGQLALAEAAAMAELPGVSILTGVIVLITLATLFLCARSQGSLLVSAVLLPLALLALAPGLSGRPQVVSYALTTVVVVLWLRANDLGRVPWIVVPLTWVWAMTHGMWVVSVAISVCALAGMALDHNVPRGRGWHYSLVPILSLVSAFLTPVGPQLVASAVRVGGISKYFEEWGPTRFTEPPAVAATLLLVLVLVIALRSPIPLPWLTLMLTLLSAGWLAYSGRTVAVCAAMLVPLVARLSCHAVPRTAPSTAERGTVAVGVMAASVLAVALALANEPDPRQHSQAHASVAELREGTPVLNDWGQGGYDMWRHPHLEIVSHGYGDMFTDDEIERNADLNSVVPGWRALIADLDVHHALLPVDSDMAMTLRDEADWTVVAQDVENPDADVPAMVHLRAP